MVMRRARTPPKMAPGKKPAITALLGKEGHEEMSVLVALGLVASLEVEAEEDGIGVKVTPRAVVSVAVDAVVVEALDVVDEADDVDDAVLEVFLSRAQVLFPWHA